MRKLEPASCSSRPVLCHEKLHVVRLRRLLLDFKKPPALTAARTLLVAFYLQESACAKFVLLLPRQKRGTCGSANTSARSHRKVALQVSVLWCHEHLDYTINRASSHKRKFAIYSRGASIMQMAIMPLCPCTPESARSVLATHSGPMFSGVPHPNLGYPMEYLPHRCYFRRRASTHLKLPSSSTGHPRRL